MTEPGLITPASTASNSRHAALPISSSQASGSNSPPSYVPSLSTSTSGSMPSTAPCSPDRVQTVSTTAQQMVTPSSPIIASQLEGVFLGLQQLERQQVEQEQKRQALEVQQLEPAPQDSEADDDTAPSSTLNSNTNEPIEADRPSSIRHFIQNTRVSQHDRYACLTSSLHDSTHSL